ncbi:glycoside hydrolase family 5 protein [Mumia sp. DW29H23]|uniref:glycoside hydrolase family 5 protein n=1 Tax=Mumia sp. DW29H23 TaxID=3421241 RepID=UPI003D693AFA
MTLRTRLVALSASLAVVLGLVSGSPVAAAPDDARGALRTAVAFPERTVVDARGNTLLADRHGRAMQLRGTNLGKFDDITEADVAMMADAGFTVLRLPIQWRKLEPAQGRYDAQYLQAIRNVLDWSHEHGLLVMVDWHQDVFGPAFGFDGIPAWATRDDGIPFEPIPGNWFYNYFHPAVQAAFHHLFNDADLVQAQTRTWTYLAKKLSGHPALLGYDLFNEPMGQISFEDLEDPEVMAGKALAFEAGDLAAMYERLIAGIRTVDSRSWLWVEPTVIVGEGVPTALPAFDDPRRGADRIGYAPHAYSTSVEDGDDWDPDSGFVEAYEAAITAYPRENRMPVLVGEWGPIGAGPSYPGNVALTTRQADSFARFASGWMIWYGCRSANGGGYCVFDDEGRLDPGRAGAWSPYALLLDGTPVSESYEQGRYVLRFRPERGVQRSQLVVPSGFGDRVTVSVRDARGRLAPVVAHVSRASRTGARTVTLLGLERRAGVSYEVTVQSR